MTDVTMEKIYTVNEVAEVFSVAPDTIRDWIKAGKIQAFKVGQQWRVRHREVLALAEVNYG